MSKNDRSFTSGVSLVKQAVAGGLVLQLLFGAVLPVSAQTKNAPTRSPIKHVIVIIGENRTFDHVFATYKPRNGESVDNLLSKGIVNEDGTPGAHFGIATQVSALTQGTSFEMSPRVKSPYA